MLPSKNDFLRGQRSGTTVPWRVDKVTSRKMELDLRPSGQAPWTVTQIFLDDVCFANAAEVTSWDEQSFQVQVCEACAVEHCNSGGWLQLRSLGEERIFIPAFEDLDSADEWEAHMYRAPHFLRAQGVPIVSRDRFTELQSIVPSLPEEPPPLLASEAARLLCWEAPRGVFRDTAEGLRFDKAPLLACTHGDLETLGVALASLLGRLRNLQTPAHVRPLTAEDTPIQIFLDDRQFTEWNPVVRTAPGQLNLMWDNYVLEESIFHEP